MMVLSFGSFGSVDVVGTTYFAEAKKINYFINKLSDS